VITQHPQQLPEPLAGTLSDPLATARLADTLRRCGLARVTPDSLQLHRIPAALLRARTTDQDPDRARRRKLRPRGGWAVTAVRLLRHAVPEDPWNNPAVWPAWRQLLPHVLAATSPNRNLDTAGGMVAWLLDHAGAYLAASGELHAAQKLSERAYHLDRNRLGADHPNTLASANNLSINLGQAGQYEQARQLDKATLERCRRVLGEDHPDTLTSASNLATHLRHLGEYEQARQLDEDTLARRRRVLGEDHPDTLTSANNLAEDLRALEEGRSEAKPNTAPSSTPPG
jgi:tetratricopeptide (TPR) repeat protein